MSFVSTSPGKALCCGGSTSTDAPSATKEHKVIFQRGRRLFCGGVLVTFATPANAHISHYREETYLFITSMDLFRKDGRPRCGHVARSGERGHACLIFLLCHPRSRTSEISFSAAVSEQFHAALTSSIGCLSAEWWPNRGEYDSPERRIGLIRSYQDHDL